MAMIDKCVICVCTGCDAVVPGSSQHGVLPLLIFLLSDGRSMADERGQGAERWMISDNRLDRC